MSEQDRKGRHPRRGARRRAVDHHGLVRPQRDRRRCPPPAGRRSAGSPHELGYRPNAAARSLKSGRSRILGVAVAHRDSQPWQRTYMPYYRSIIAGAAIEAVEHGHAVAAIPVGPDGALDLSVPVDGLIVVDPGRRDPLLATCVERGIPVVADGRPLDRRFVDVPVVDSDIRGGMAAVLQHLVEQHVRRAALLTGPQTDAYTLDTEQAFRALARQHGIDAEVRRIGRRESADAVAREMLGGDRRPTPCTA